MPEANENPAIPKDVQQLMASVVKSDGRLEPYGIAEHLQPIIEKLGLSD